MSNAQSYADKYEKIVEYYQRYYVNAVGIVERKIRSYVERGYTREEAIEMLYTSIFGKFEYGYSRGASSMYNYSVAPNYAGKPSFLTILSYSYNAFTLNPLLAVPVLIRDSISYFQSAFIFFVLVFLINSLASLGFSNISDNLSLLLSLIEHLSYMFYVVLALVVVIMSAVEAFYWSSMISATLRVSGGAWLTSKGVIHGLGRVMDLFKALVIANSVKIGIPAAIILTSVLGAIRSMLGGSIATIFILIAVIGLMGIAYIASSFFLTFVPHTVYIEGYGPTKAVKESIRMVVRSFSDVLIYYLFWIVVQSIAATTAYMLSLLSVSISNLIAFIISVIVTPIMDLSLTEVYLLNTNRSISMWVKRRNLLGLISRYIGAGIIELKSFLFRPENYPFILLSVFAFILSSIHGYFLGIDYLRPFRDLIVRPGRINPIMYQSPFSLALEIFFNNWKIGLISTVSGVGTPILPALIAYVNGWLLGLVSSKLTLYELLVAIGPHGVIELPSLIIALAAGFKLGFYYLFRRKLFPEELKRCIKVGIGLAPLFLLAAVIEATVTPALIKYLLGWS